MKTIGLIGGMSWVSTADYYRLINEMVSERLGGSHSAELLLYSVDFEPIERQQAAEDWDGMGARLSEIAQRLESAGADCLLLCTNTMHKVAPQIAAGVKIPLLHIADCTAQAVRARNLRRVALLGTRYTMAQPFLRRRLEQHGLDVVIPSAGQQQIVHDVIYDELIKNEIRDESRRAYQTIVGELQQEGAEAVLLACTEIPLLLKQPDSTLPLFDTTYWHARAAVDFALAGEKL